MVCSFISKLYPIYSKAYVYFQKLGCVLQLLDKKVLWLILLGRIVFSFLVMPQIVHDIYCPLSPIDEIW